MINIFYQLMLTTNTLTVTYTYFMTADIQLVFYMTQKVYYYNPRVH